MRYPAANGFRPGSAFEARFAGRSYAGTIQGGYRLMESRSGHWALLARVRWETQSGAKRARDLCLLHEIENGQVGAVVAALLNEGYPVRSPGGSSARAATSFKQRSLLAAARARSAQEISP